MARRCLAWFFPGHRCSGPPRAAVRGLRVERLEPRVVLTGLTDPVLAAPPSDTGGTLSPEVCDSPVEMVPAAVSALAYPLSAPLAGSGSVPEDVWPGAVASASYLVLASAWETWAMSRDVAATAAAGETATVAGGAVSVSAGPTGDAALTSAIVPELETGTLGGGTDVELPPLPEPDPNPPGAVTLPPLTAPPVIMDFTGASDGGFWEFTGRVTDDTSVTGLVVRFGGLLEGMTATVNQFGCFSIAVFLSAGTRGGVTAITTDGDGLDSNLACFFVDC